MKTFSVRLYCPGLFAGYGGAEKYSATLAQFLVDTYKDLDIGFVVYGDSLNTVQYIALLNERYGLSLPLEIGAIFLREGNSNLPGRFFSQRKLRSTSSDIDLFINCFHNVHFFNAKKNVHIVHFPAGRRVEQSPLFVHSTFLKPIGAFLDRRYERCYDLFICNSEYTRKWLRKYWNISPQRSIVLYPPSSHSLSTTVFHANEKEKMILMVSRFDPRKKILEVVDYFSRHEANFPGWRLVVAGSVVPDSVEYYNKIAWISNGHRIELRSNPSTQELSSLYRAASIFWHAMGLNVDEDANPIDIEHFGITTVEAMESGAVPVVIDKGGQREIVDEGINGFRWTTLKSLGDATRMLIEDRSLCNTLAEAAVAKSKRYSLEEFYRCATDVFMKFELIPKEYLRV